MRKKNRDESEWHHPPPPPGATRATYPYDICRAYAPTTFAVPVPVLLLVKAVWHSSLFKSGESSAITGGGQTQILTPSPP